MTPSPSPIVPEQTFVKVLRLGQAIFPEIFDPQKSALTNDVQPLKICYEGLTRLDANSNIVPGAADRYESSVDGTSMTFHIREELKRADGTPMNASDFEYALKRQVDPRVTGKQYTDLAREIKGADPLIDSEGKKLSDDELAKLYSSYGVKADDSNRQLTVTFNRPIGFWKYVASTSITFSPDKNKVDSSPASWWSKAEGHNCYGPFKFKTIDEGKRIVYEANSNYWQGRPKLDRIEVNYISDDAQRLAAFKNGELEQVDVTAATLDSATTDTILKAQLARYPAAITTIIGFNNIRKPFDDKNVRLAFSQALDREGWVKQVLGTIGKPYTRWIPPGVSGAQIEKSGVPGYDPKGAVETLIKNGYGTADGKKVDCAKLGELKLTYPTSAKNSERFQFLAKNFASVFNCPVTLDPIDPTQYATLSRDPTTSPKISRQGFLEDYPYPDNWLSLYWKCDGFAKRYYYCNKSLDLLLNTADASTNSDDAIKLYKQAEDVLLSDVPGAPISYAEHLYLIKPYAIGLRENLSSSDYAWAGEWGPIWTYDIDLSSAPDSYPKQ